MSRATVGLVALSTVLLAGVLAAPAALGAPATCTSPLVPERGGLTVQGSFGGEDCREDWMLITSNFDLGMLGGTLVLDVAEGGPRPAIDVHPSFDGTSWEAWTGMWGTKRLGFRMDGNRLSGGIGLVSDDEVRRAMAGEQVGVPISARLDRRDLAPRVRTMNPDWSREDDLRGGHCQIGDRRIDVSFTYTREWEEQTFLSDAERTLESVTVTNDRVYGPLCLGLLLVTPLPEDD